jgi:hypothetical protein
VPAHPANLPTHEVTEDRLRQARELVAQLRRVADQALAQARTPGNSFGTSSASWRSGSRLTGPRSRQPPPGARARECGFPHGWKQLFDALVRSNRGYPPAV